MTMFVSSKNLPLIAINLLAVFFDHLRKRSKIIDIDCSGKPEQCVPWYTADTCCG